MENPPYTNSLLGGSLGFTHFIFLSVLLYFAVTPTVPQKMEYFMHHLGMLHTVHSREEAAFFNIAYWSLPLEVEFYLAVPLLSLLIHKLVRFSSVAKILIAFLIFGLVTHTATVVSGSFLANILAIHLPGLLIEFLIGTMAFQLSRNKIAIGKSVLLFFIGLLILFFLGAFFVRYGDNGVANNFVLKLFFGTLCAIAYACILCATVHITVFDKFKMKFELLCQFSGKMSYGLYLFHNLAPMLFAYVVAFLPFSPIYQYMLYCVFTMLLVLVLNKWYEEPLNSYGKRLSI